MLPAKPCPIKLVLAFLCVFAAPPAAAQTPWIHTEVTAGDGAHIKVNVPFSPAEAAASMMTEKMKAELLGEASKHDISLADLRKLRQAVKTAGAAPNSSLSSPKRKMYALSAPAIHFRSA